MESKTLNSIHVGEQVQESTAQLAEIIGRYWSALPMEMPEETRLALTEVYSAALFGSIFLTRLDAMLLENSRDD